MEIWEAIVLGAIQGLTEFLPVSSSGHLELVAYLFGIQEPNNMQFVMAVHGATVLSTILVFWKEILEILKGVFKFTINEQSIFAFNICISLIPILFVGLMFKDQIESLFTANLLNVGAMLVFTSILLTIATYVPKGNKPITPKSAFIMGIAQSLAVLPGLSRSGSTISVGLMQGLNPEKTARFSFLMVLIPIVGMNILELFSLGSETEQIASQGIGTMPIIWASITAFLTGAAACKWMIRIVQKGSFMWFALYCFIVGVTSIIIYL